MAFDHAWHQFWHRPAHMGMAVACDLGTIRLLAVIAANFVLHSGMQKSRPRIAPVGDTIFSTCIRVFFLRVFGPIDIGVLIANIKHMNYATALAFY